MVDISGVLKLVVGLGVVGITLVIVNLVYSTVVSSMPAGSTPLFDLSVVDAAANLVGPLLILMVGGVIIGILLGLARAAL